MIDCKHRHWGSIEELFCALLSDTDMFFLCALSVCVLVLMMDICANNALGLTAARDQRHALLCSTAY